MTRKILGWVCLGIVAIMIISLAILSIGLKEGLFACGFLLILIILTVVGFILLEGEK